MTTKQKVLKLEDLQIKVSVEQICSSVNGWKITDGTNNKEIGLRRFPDGCIHFLVNGKIHRSLCWMVVEQEYENRSRNSGQCKPYSFYVVKDGRRYSHLYIHNGSVGTRDGFAARYSSTCFSRKQRAIYKAYRKQGISRTRSREQALEKRRRGSIAQAAH